MRYHCVETECNSFRKLAMVIHSSQTFKSKARRRINQLIFKNIYDLKGLTTLERFMVTFRVIVSKSFANYANKEFSQKRLTVAYLWLLIDYLMVIRFTIITIVNKPWIWVITGDAFYKWGMTCLMSATFASFGCAIASINTLYLWG